MSRKRVDVEMVALAMEAIRSKQETIRSAGAKFGVNPSSLAKRLHGKVKMDARPVGYTRSIV